MKNSVIEVQNTKVTIVISNNNDYICISDFIKVKEGKSKEERFDIFTNIAKYQLNILNSADEIKLLEDKNSI